MNRKDRVLNSIMHKGIDRVPLMYRALPDINTKLLKYFHLDPDINKSWQKLMEVMGFDLFSGGNGIGKFTKFKPSYLGKLNQNPLDTNLFYTFGIKSYYDEISNSINYKVNKDFAKLSTISEVSKYCFPSPLDFDYEWINPPLHLKDICFLGVGTLNSIFMIALYLRGVEQLMLELLTNKKLAKYYIDRIGEFVLEFSKRTFQNTKDYIEFFAVWDDLAMQNGLMIPYYSFKEFFYPWYKKIFTLAREYNLITYFHICGSAIEIIPDLIDIGVEILDPVQVSAKYMQLDLLKKKYGRNICYHGGIDVQNMLPFKKAKEIKDYIKRVVDIFGTSGGIILGPSHEIMVDTPIENILAIYS